MATGSRAARSVTRSTITGSKHRDQEGSYYTIELDGFEEYEPSPGIDSDVVGNVLVHHGIFGIRVGGDGTGSLRGRVRLANNTFIVGESFDQYTPVIRLFGMLDAVYLVNNAFFKIGANPLFRLWRNDIETENWVTGAVKFVGHNNWVPRGCDFSDKTRWPPGMSDTLLGEGNPGFADVSSFDNLDLAVVGGSQLAGMSYSIAEQKWTGTGNSTANPLFADSEEGDFHLRSSTGRWDHAANGGNGGWVVDTQHSPGIDAGDPAADFSFEPLANGSRVNIGMYGGTQEASQSLSN